MKELWELFCRMIWLERINKQFIKSEKHKRLGVQYYSNACTLLDRYNEIYKSVKEG